jgi:hypothetical protein
MRAQLPVKMVVVPCKSLLQRGRTEIITGIDNTSKDDGIQSYNVKTGRIEVRFMTGNNKGFNVARDLKQFLASAREQDDRFTIVPLAGIGNSLCMGADVPNSKAGIEK